MPVALFIAGNFWFAATLAFGFGSRVVIRFATGQPAAFKFLGTDDSVSPTAYYSGLVILLVAAVICFVLSYVAWRRQNHPTMRSTGAAEAFPVILEAGENGLGH